MDWCDVTHAMTTTFITEVFYSPYTTTVFNYWQFIYVCLLCSYREAINQRERERALNPMLCVHVCIKENEVTEN